MNINSMHMSECHSRQRVPIACYTKILETSDITFEKQSYSGLSLIADHSKQLIFPISKHSYPSTEIWM